MKILEQIALTIFSLLILIICLALCLVLFGWLETSNIYIIIQYLKSAQSITNTALIVSVVLMLLAVKCIFFPSYAKEKEQKSEGILLENETGKLLISIETIENLLREYKKNVPEYLEYKNTVLNLEQNFINQINEIFGRYRKKIK